MSVEWKFVKYDNKSLKKESKRQIVDDHPLRKSINKFASNQNVTKNVPTDPLSLALDGYDPLSMYSDDYFNTSSNGNVKPKDEWLELWQSRRAAILTKYTTAEKLSIISSFLPGGEKILMKTQTYVVDQVKTRLEQLDDFEVGSVRQMLNLSQQEYVMRIDMLNKELVQAWNTEQRVKALKIAIQCSKLLVDTTVMQFYPSKFVLITDILDIFGKLVYERLRNKAEYFDPSLKRGIPLPENFTPDMVSETAKETCLNWLYKMASIRELVPRLYIEMSLLKCYSFLTSDEFSSALLRITSMIRGIGHPLVSLYARFYLCRVGLSVRTSNKDFFVQNVNDFLLTYSQVFSKSVLNELKSQNIDRNKYISLYGPALDWLLHGMVEWANVSNVILDQLIKQCKNMQHCDLLLRSIISSLKPNDVTSRALQMLELICSSSKEDQTTCDMIVILGQRVCCGGRSTDDKKLLSSVWKIVRNFQQIKHFLACAEPWVQFTAMNFSVKQIDWLLGDIYAIITKSEETLSDYYVQLQAILKKIALFTPDIEELFAYEHLLPMLELFDAGPYLMESSKSMLSTYQSQQNYLINDEVLISNLTQICLLLHDSINSFTVEDELKHVGELVCRFIAAVSFGKDYQRQLKFYTEIRASFFKLDMLYPLLVQLVNNLLMNTRGLLIRKDVKKFESFARSCVAYNFITVPSVPCPFMKIKLYLLSGQVALFNFCYIQAEDCLKASLNALIKIPPKSVVDGQIRSNDSFVMSFLSSFMSTLLMLPDKQQNGNSLYMFKGMLKALNCLSWESIAPPRYAILLKTFDLLSNLIQEDYLYHAGDAIANDTLLVYNSNYVQQINEMCSIILDELLSILQQLGEKNEFHKQSSLAMELFWKVIKRGDTNVKSIETLAVNLWSLAHKHKNCVDYKISKKMLTSLELDETATKIHRNIIIKIKSVMTP